MMSSERVGICSIFGNHALVTKRQVQLGCLFIGLFFVLFDETKLLPGGLLDRSVSTTTCGKNATGMASLRDPKDQLGSWLGNTWIPPPGWRYYNVTELKTFYHGKRILFLGDSTARRTGMVLYSLLNETATSFNNASIVDPSSSHVSHDRLESLIDLNRRRQSHPCSQDMFALCLPLPAGGDLFFRNAPCLKSVESFIPKYTELVASMDLIVVALGVWHSVRQSDCQDPRSLHEQVSHIVEMLKEMIPLAANNTKGKFAIVWRTSGWSESGKTQPKIEEYNAAIRKVFDEVQSSGHRRNSILTYMDWGNAVRPRSFGKDRIAGDIVAHYGLEARLSAVMMLTNVLDDHQWSTASE